MLVELTRVIDALPGLGWTALPNGRAEFLNHRWLNYTGMTAERAAGSGWTEAIHPDDRNGLIEHWQSCVASGTPMDAEARMRRYDGIYRWFLFRANPLRDEAGTISRWYGTNIDIEDRKRGEEDLRASELSWRQIVDNIPGLVATMGATGEVEFLNRQTLEYFGKTSEDLRNWSLIGVVHPDDLPRVLEERMKAVETGQVYHIEHRCRGADGVYRWFQVRSLPVRNAQGNPTAWYLLLTDIDDLKKAEHALQSSERSLSLILNAIPGYIQVLRADGSLLYVNQQVLDYIGITAEEALKEDYRARFFHPEDVARLREKRREALTRRVPFELEQRLLRKDGSYRWFLIRYSPLLDEQGRIDRWYCVGFDIEDRKRAEEALQSNERNLRLIINAMPTNMHVLRADGSVLYVNQPVLDYMGITLEDALQEDYRTRFFHPDDVTRLREQRREALTRPVPFENEQRVLRKDGSYRWHLIRYNPVLDEQGRIDQWYVAAFDIEDRKRAEAQVEQAYLRLAEAQQLSKTGSFITDLVADEHNWSEEAFRIFGFDPGAKVSVQMIREMVHPEDLPSFDAMIARAMTGTDVDFHFRIVTVRSTMKYVRGMARVIEQVAGRPLFIGALQDVTASKVAEEALNRARSELAHVARVTTLNTLTASIAHEVNQPLSGIITNASTCQRMLNADPPNVEGARETVRRTIRDGKRASEVISRLRALYGKKEFTLEPLDLNEATQEVIALSLSDLQRNRVILRSELARDLPSVTGDRIQLQQVILNLVRNASDAMVDIEDRPRELLIRTEWDQDDCVRLSVRDAGVGFRPDTLDKLFEAFYTTKSDGMGIGLSVSRSIIEAHQGRLWATANDGAGATFCFSLPCGSRTTPGLEKPGAAALDVRPVTLHGLRA